MIENKFQLIARNTVDWIYWVKPDGNIEFHSDSVSEVTGFPLNEIQNNLDFITDIVVDEDKEKFLQHLKEGHFENPETLHIEFRIKTKQGKIKTISHLCKPIYDNGKYIGRLADNRDVSLQKEQEELICLDRERFDLYVNNIKDVIWEVDVDYQLKYISPSIEDIVGIPAEELIGKSILQLLNIKEGSDIAIFLQNRRKRFFEEGIVDTVLFELPYKKDDNDTIWFEVHSHPLIRKGILKGFIGVARNITNRIKYKQKLESIIDITDNGVWEWDLSINKPTFSDRYYTMLGYEPGEFEETFEGWKSIIHPEDYEAVAKRFLSFLENKNDSYVIEYRMKTKNDKWKWIKSKGRVIEWDKNGIAKRLLGVHIDIDAEKRQQEEKLNILNAAIQATTESIAITDVRGNIEYVNPAFLELTGYTLEEAIGKNPRDLVKSGEQSKDFYVKMWKTIANGQTWKGEIINRKKDGSKYIEFLTITPVKNEYGKIAHYIAIKRDITYERELLRELNKTNAELQAIYDSSPLLIALLDKNAKIVYANKTITDFLKTSLDELVGKRACSCFGCINYNYELECGTSPNCSGCRLNAAIQQTLTTKQSVVGIEHEAKYNINGQIQDYVFLATTSLIKSDSNEFVLLNLLDITEKKKSEQLLEQSLKMFRTYVQSAPMGIVSIDRNGEISGCNKAFTELIKETEDNLLNRNLNDYIFKFGELFTENIINLERENKIVEIIMQDSKDKIFWAKINMVRLNDSEILCFIEDIDLKKRIEEDQRALLDALRESNKQTEQALTEKNALIDELEESKLRLQETINAKDKFFSIISHDLRGPFSGFLGLTDMMAKDLEDLSVRELKKMSQAIYNSANSVYKLLDDLLQWSRLQLGKIPFYPEKISLMEIVKNSIFTLKEVANEKNIALQIDIPENLIVCCDRNMITGVIRNLVSNGIKFTNRNGRIKIYANKLDEKTVEISVKDNGVGIPEEVQKDLFKIDKHTTTTGTERESGSGLGLILCKEFVEKHNGNIYFTSKVGEGSTFSFTLPLECNKFDVQ